jgi:hypothetical protein
MMTTVDGVVMMMTPPFDIIEKNRNTESFAIR